MAGPLDVDEIVFKCEGYTYRRDESMTRYNKTQHLLLLWDFEVFSYQYNVCIFRAGAHRSFHGVLQPFFVYQINGFDDILSAVNNKVGCPEKRENLIPGALLQPVKRYAEFDKDLRQKHKITK
jgi:hypothetical protein